MKLKWDEEAWQDYLYWQTQDKKTLKRINMIVTDIMRSPFDGIGKPEPLKHRQGYWNRRINETNRLVYKVDGDAITIALVKGHYCIEFACCRLWKTIANHITLQVLLA